MDDLAGRWNDFKKSMGLDISEKANRAEMMDEAAERMKMLGLAEDAISEFRNSGLPGFGMENGQYFPLSDSEKAQIQTLEGNEEYLVYAVVRNDSSYGKMVNYIMVSWHKCDWGLERMNLTERSFVLAYVYNCDFPGNSETGTIEVKCLPGGMLDRRM